LDPSDGLLVDIPTSLGENVPVQFKCADESSEENGGRGYLCMSGSVLSHNPDRLIQHIFTLITNQLPHGESQLERREDKAGFFQKWKNPEVQSFPTMM
jgi:hypothetical protein